MPKFLRKTLLFLLFSVLLYYISYLSSNLSGTFFPNPSFYDLSTFVDRFDDKIRHLNIASLKVEREPDDEAESDFGEESAEASAGHHKSPKPSVQLPPGEVNTYFFYLLRILLRFLFLIFVQVYVFYILLFRYGQLFKDLCDLSFKSLKEFNWRSPINFLKSIYGFSLWLGSIFLYYNSLLSVRCRLVAYSAAVLIISALLFRAGIGSKRLLNTSPLLLALTIYLAILLTFSSNIPTLLVMLDNYFVYIWTILLFVRGFKVKVIHGESILELRVDDAKLSHESACLLDLHLVLLMLNFFRSIPVLGHLLESTLYISHVSLFFLLCMAIHCVLVYSGDASAISGTPLSPVRRLVLELLNGGVLYLFGVPDYFSTAGRMNNLFKNHLGRLKQVFQLVFGRFLEPLNEHRGVALAIKGFKSIPQLLLLLLPPMFSRLYFEYFTLVIPITAVISHGEDLVENAYCLMLFVLSNFARSLASLLSWITFRTSLRIALIFILNYALVVVKSLIKAE